MSVKLPIEFFIDTCFSEQQCTKVAFIINQQYEYICFLRQEATRPELETQEKLSFQLLQSQVNVQIIKMDLAKANVIHLNKEEKRLQELKSTLQLKTKELERQKSNLDRQMSNLSRSKSNLSRTRFNLRSAAVRKKSSIVPPKSRKVSTDSRGDGKADETHEPRIGKEIKEFVLEIKRTKKVLEQQLKEGERDLMRKEKELDMKEKEFNTARDYKINTYSDLTTKLKGVIENMKKLYSSKQSDMMRKHDKEINEFIQVKLIYVSRHFTTITHVKLYQNKYEKSISYPRNKHQNTMSCK